MNALKNKDLKEYRHKRWIQNNRQCPILKREIPFEETVVDHIHSEHKILYPETNKLIRDVIHRDINTLIGKIENQFMRIKREIRDEVNLPDLLRNIADYIEKYSNIENFNEKLIHPSEIKTKKIKKSFFNKLKKIVEEKEGKEIQFPKSGKLTKEIEKYAKKYSIEIEYY